MRHLNIYYAKKLLGPIELENTNLESILIDEPNPYSCPHG